MSREIVSRGIDHRPWRCGGAALVLLSLVACASSSGPDLRVVEAGTQARKLLVMPLNVVTSLPVELEEVSEEVDTRVLHYVASHDKEVARISFRDASMLWQASIRRAHAEDSTSDFFDAIAILARQVASQVSFDTLVIPSLLLRPAEMRVSRAEWDETKRPVQLAGLGHDPQGNAMMSRVDLNGTLQAASLYVLLVQPDGELLQERTIGISPIEEMRMMGSSEDRPTERPLIMAPTVRRMLDREHELSDAIERSFAPFLQPASSE